LAPVVVLNGQVSGKATPDAVMKRVKEVVSLSKEKLQQQQEVG
jgi:NADH:ubiquinone oxidoreductase subunit E